MTSQYIENGNCAMMQYEALGDPAYLERAVALWKHDIRAMTHREIAEAGAVIPDALIHDVALEWVKA